jgi:hypothetical protein
MHAFWEPVVEPLLDAAGAQSVVEVGAERGLTTKRLLTWSARTGAVVHSIDPAPRFDAAAWEREHGGRFRMHPARSLDALGSVGAVDAALLDGDHNWFTVLSELRLLAGAAAEAGEQLPLIVAHDAGWPYGRRDMYYDPGSVPAEYRQTAERAGMAPGRSELGRPGINAGLWNATAEGGPRNGVLTAIEDFAAEHPAPCELLVLEGMYGLALLCSEARLGAAPPLRAEFERLRSPAFLREWLAAVEAARLDTQVRIEDEQ